MDTFTSLLAGCTIFSVLGNLSHELGVPIANVTEGDAGLAFEAYPQAIAQFGWAPQVSLQKITQILYGDCFCSGAWICCSFGTVLTDFGPNL